ncbi:Uncharacterised protein [Bordetella pertussis]|nr:Uncharacterised protein [Bordetella pertussis]
MRTPLVMEQKFSHHANKIASICFLRMSGVSAPYPPLRLTIPHPSRTPGSHHGPKHPHRHAYALLWIPSASVSAASAIQMARSRCGAQAAAQTAAVQANE